MPLPTGLDRHPDSGYFQLRIGVPDDVRPYWPLNSNGKPAADAYRRSLRTRDRNEALTQAHALIADYNRQFQALRDRNRPQRTQLTPKLVEYLQSRIKYELLEGDDLRRISGRVLGSVPMDLAGDMPELTNAERLQVWAKVVRTMQANGDYGFSMGFVDKLLDAMGLPPADWAGQLKPLALFGRTLAQTYTAIAERSTGELVDTPHSPGPYVPAAPPEVAPVAAQAAQTLQSVVPHWIKLKESEPNAIQRMNYALTLWEDAVGDVPLDQITRATGGEFVMYLLDEEREFGRKTAKNHASNINSVVNVAVQLGLIQANPLIMKFDINDSEKRVPWTDAELTTLHKEPVTGEQPKGVDPTDADLLINMLLWSGARISEIARLRVQDISKRDGILAAYIRRETTKNDESVRWLPIASAIREQVAAHAKRRKDGGHKRAPLPKTALWQKVKVDWQVVAIAKARGCDLIVSNDPDVLKLGQAAGIKCQKVDDLPIPEALRQIPIPLTPMPDQPPATKPAPSQIPAK